MDGCVGGREQRGPFNEIRENLDKPGGLHPPIQWGTGKELGRPPPPPAYNGMKARRRESPLGVAASPGLGRDHHEFHARRVSCLVVHHFDFMC